MSSIFHMPLILELPFALASSVDLLLLAWLLALAALVSLAELRLEPHVIDYFVLLGSIVVLPFQPPWLPFYALLATSIVTRGPDHRLFLQITADHPHCLRQVPRVPLFLFHYVIGSGKSLRSIDCGHIRIH